MTSLRLILACLGLALLAACAPQPVAEGVDLIQPGEAAAIQTAHVDALNAFRAEQGLGPVTLSARLTAAARTHARDMSVQRRAWHFGSDGTSPRDRAARAGFAGEVVGENISESFDDPTELFRSWLADPVTRRVMLAREADSVGLGWHQEPNGKLWWVQVLGDSRAISPVS